MIQCERFVYALFNGVGYKILKTANLDRILTKQNLERLSILPSKKDNYIHWLETEKLIAISHVDRVKDEYGREGTKNQTVLLTVPDYLSLSDISKSLDKLFLKNEFNPNQSLEPIEI